MTGILAGLIAILVFIFAFIARDEAEQSQKEEELDD